MEQGVVRLPEQRSTTIKGKRRHGDAAIAGALAYFASQVETHEFSYQPAPRPAISEPWRPTQCAIIPNQRKNSAVLRAHASA